MAALNEIVESGQLELVDDALDHAETVMFRLPASDAAMMARRRETVTGVSLLAAYRPDPVVPRSSRRAWLLFVLLVVIAGAAAAWHMGLRIPWLPGSP